MSVADQLPEGRRDEDMVVGVGSLRDRFDRVR